MPDRPALDLPAVSVEHCINIINDVYAAGGANVLEIDLNALLELGCTLTPKGPPPPPDKHELLTRYLYLNAVLDQGRDSVGVGMLLSRVLNILYRDRSISPLSDPLSFFASASAVIEVIEYEHARVKEERHPQFPRMRYYSLYDQYRVTPWVAFRWGAPLLNILRFEARTRGVIGWLRSFPSGESAADAIKHDDLYGLGGAIGEKASRLFVKWLTYTGKILAEWGPNSHEVPLDANVGRVLMRSGVIFALFKQDDLWSGSPAPWTLQPDGQVNLSAQALNQKTLARVPDLDPIMLEMLASWGFRTRRSNIRFMRAISAMLILAAGHDAQVGQLDDGFMYIGRNVCHNTNPACGRCPLQRRCLANNLVPALKETFYCGTGTNVFF